MATQTQLGKAFEFACLSAFETNLGEKQPVEIETSSAYTKARDYFEKLDNLRKEKMIKAAEAAAELIIQVEPQLQYPQSNTPLVFAIQSDATGQSGDVRDILCIRRQNEWQIGLSCKHNHAAVKHSRLSSKIDFGSKWLGLKCSSEYFNEINPIFEELSELRIKEMKWDEIDDKEERFYRPVLNAFITELERLVKKNSDVPASLLKYLIGNNDFYKIISSDSDKTTQVDAFNLYGTLNKASGNQKSAIKVGKLKLPSRFKDISYKRGSNTTIEVTCDKGWEFSMRIHNASSKVEASLKFDINLIGVPRDSFRQTKSWEPLTIEGDQLSEKIVINLFENEIYKVQKQTANTKKMTSEEINKFYSDGEIRIVTEQGRYPLVQIYDMFKSDEYVIQPDYQRRRRWSNNKKSGLIESFIMNVPIPPIFLYEKDYASYEIMDGLQRITTICEFYANKFELSGLEEWRVLNGYKYSNLPSQVKKGIDRRYLSSVILLNESAKTEKDEDKLKRFVFQRLNSGGVVLSPQEKRNALYDGEFNRLCILLSSDSNFVWLWQLDGIDDQINDEISSIFDDDAMVDKQVRNSLHRSMGDVELVLRFFALRHIEQFKIGLSKFLDYYLSNANEYDNITLNRLKALFIDTMKVSLDIFGDNAFCLYDIETKKWTKPTRTIYDPLTIVISQRLHMKDKLYKDKKLITQRVKNLYIKEIEKFSGKKQSKNDIIRRAIMLGKAVDGVS